MKKLSSFLIVLGILIMLTPIVGRILTIQNEKRLIDEWNKGLDEISSTEEASSDQLLSSLSNVFEEERTSEPEIAPIDIPIPTPVATTKVTPKANPKPSQKMLGLIEIKKIKVNLPIVEGVESSNLKAGIGHIPSSAGLGQLGNSALAGHRSYTFGNFFNRLDELQIGDIITITTKKSKYTYTIYEKLVVLPENVSVLKSTKDESIITLITCTPVRVATHRLIVHARLEKSE
jgi:sortase A